MPGSSKACPYAPSISNARRRHAPCEHQAKRVAGRRCAELGAGAGLVGICLHRAGAESVLLTDLDAQALRNCRRNLEENGVALSDDSRVSHQVVSRALLQWTAAAALTRNLCAHAQGTSTLTGLG